LTAPATLNRGEAFVTRIQLSPLRTRDVPGFAVNRLLFPYLEAAVALIRGGVEWERIERCATDFGMRLGPLSQMDEIGIDVILRAAAAFHRGNPVVPPQSELLLAMYQAGRLGRKSGRGFFDYSLGGDRVVADPESKALVATHAGIPVECSDCELQCRLFVPMFAGACELVERDIVAGECEVRAALKGGLGCRGEAADLPGWGRRLGSATLVEWRERLQLPDFDPAVLC
jgi:3-hydroxyacyl-CoA dehydrogenase